MTRGHDPVASTRIVKSTTKLRNRKERGNGMEKNEEKKRENERAAGRISR